MPAPGQDTPYFQRLTASFQQAPKLLNPTPGQPMDGCACEALFDKEVTSMRVDTHVQAGARHQIIDIG